MATTNHSNNSHSTQSTTTTSRTAATATKPRTRVRKPPVAERVTVSAPLAVPPAAPPGGTPTPTPATGASGPTSPPAGSGSSGSSGNGGNGASTATFPVSAPPQAVIPPVPAGFVPVNPLDLRGFRMMASQVAAVPDAITELQSFANYVGVFGITAPDPAQLTQRVNVAYQWTMLLSQTAAWYKYAKSQQGMAWKDAILLLDALKPPFDLAATANPAMLSQYPSIARLLGSKSAVAKRAASTRKKNKAAAQAAPAPAQQAAGEGAAMASPPAPAAAGAPAHAPAPAPAAAPPPATGGSNGAPAQAERVVTVQG